jgi:UDP-glucose 4-epimerase
MSSPKLILVTGGAGFVGSHLCERLVKEGHRVISLDNYFAGSRENHVAGVEYREGHTKDIAQLVPERLDLIYHLGEYSRVHKSLEEPQLVWDMNIRGSQAVFEFCRTKGCKVVYAASSTKSQASTRTGEEKSSRDISPYTWGKATNVELLNNYGAWYGLSYAIVYFYNVYGPRERAWGSFGTVIETFRQNFLAGAPHKVNAPGTQTRSFTHVLDTIDGIVLAGEKGAGDGYNISANDVHSIVEVAEMFGGAIELRPQTKTSRSSGADDTSKIESLGWKPSRTLAAYIAEEKAKKP